MSERGELTERPILERPDTIYEDSPFSLINMVSDALQRAIASVPDELREMTEGKLKEMVEPTRVDHALRVSFWREFEKTMALGRGKVQTNQIFAGICTEGYFYNFFLAKPAKVAWLIRPQQTYAREMEAILLRGTERLWELMEIDFKDKTGKVKVREGELFLKAFQEVANRVKGMAVQRSESKKLIAKTTINQEPPKAVGQESLEDLRRRQAELERKLNASVVGGVGSKDRDDTSLPASAPKEEREVIDVTPVRSNDRDDG